MPKTHSRKNNAQKIRVSPFATILTFVLFLLGCFCFALPWLEKGGPNPTFTKGVFIVLLIFLLFTFCLFLWGLIYGWAIVFIDEEGLHKSLFGIFFKKTILWEQIKCIRNIRRQRAGWVFFSKSDIIGMGITRCTLRRDNISIMYSKKLNDLLKKYYGVNIET